MNSSQRRRNRRHFRFVVRVSAAHAERYFQHDEKIEHALVWCCRFIKPDDWNSSSTWHSTDFKFAKESDAVFFKLKWA